MRVLNNLMNIVKLYEADNNIYGDSIIPTISRAFIQDRKGMEEWYVANESFFGAVSTLRSSSKNLDSKTNDSINQFEDDLEHFKTDILKFFRGI
jgi:hypothetical protein